MKYTENYKLLMPDENDFFDVLNDNKNMDMLDTALKEMKEDGANHASDQNNPHNVTAAQVGASNPNLLINSNFRNPVNQRGFTQIYSDGRNQMTIDRWRYFANTSVNTCQLTENGLLLTQNQNAACRIVYFFEHLAEWAGKTVTLSGDIDIVESFTVYVYVDGTYLNKGTYDTSGNFSCTFSFPETITTDLRLLVQTSAAQGNNMLVKWLKLEEGSVATHFVPRSYGEELAACQRYYQTLNSYLARVGSAFTRKYIYVLAPLTVPMRLKPTLCNLPDKVSVNVRTVTGQFSYSLDKDNIKVDDFEDACIQLIYTLPDGNNITEGTPLSLHCPRINSGIWSLDAEIY